MLLLALAMAAAVADAPATSQPPASPSGGAAASSKPHVSAANDPDKIVCKTEEVTGSHFERRVCMTRADWDRQTLAAQKFEQQIHEAAASNGGSAPP